MIRNSFTAKFFLALCAVVVAVLLYQFAGAGATDAQNTAPQPVEVRAPVAEDKRPTVLVVGDSLSAGYGLRDTADGWVALLQQRLDSSGYDYRVVNASISGDTSNGGAARLPMAIDTHQPSVVIIELGGNDGLRGLPIAVMRSNFERMINAALQANARVMLLGMMIPPNYGERYTEAFSKEYANLAAQYDLALVPFFLDQVALNDSLMQGDGIHPNEQAQPVMLDNVWPALAALLGDPPNTTP